MCGGASTGTAGRAPTNDNRSPQRRRPAVLLAVAAALVATGGCGTQNLDFELQVFTAQRPVVDAYRAFDSRVEPLECFLSEGEDTIYVFSRYQWARLNAMALRGKGIRRTYENKFVLKPDDQFNVSVTTEDEKQLDVELAVSPDSCCTWTLSHVAYTLRDDRGTSTVTFGSMWPIIQNILVQLPPTHEGGPWTWILMNIEEPADYVQPDPTKE